MDSSAFLDAEVYSQNHRLVQEMVAQAVGEFLPLQRLRALDGGARVLDLGVGTGENIRRVAASMRAASIVGVDWNEKFLEFARRHQPQDGPQLQLLAADLNDVDWPKALPADGFDLVTSFLTLHWVRNLTNCLDGMRRAMTPGHTLMFHVVGIRPGPSFQAAMRQLAATERWGRVVREFMHSTRWQDPAIADWRAAKDPAAAFADILRGAGFEVSLCTKMPFAYTTQSEAECRGHLKWLVPFAGALEPSTQSELLDDFMAAYASSSQQLQPGQFVWQNEVLVVLGGRQLCELPPAAGCQ